MKLAEALLLRADLQKKLASLQERINRNVLVQEGERPSEDPVDLLTQAAAVAAQLQGLVYGINRSNISGKTGRNRSLTEALAERDILALRHSIVQGAAQSAAKPPERYGVKEIRWVKVVDVAKLQGEADELARAIREINAEIQAANWELEITEP